MLSYLASTSANTPSPRVLPRSAPQQLWPLNKRIWTPIFALLSSGVCLCLLALLHTIVDLYLSRRWTGQAIVFVTSASLAYVPTIVLANLALVYPFTGDASFSASDPTSLCTLVACAL